MVFTEAMDNAIVRRDALASKFSCEPVLFFTYDLHNGIVKKEYVTLEGIKQYYIDVVQDNYKYDIFCFNFFK